MAGITMNGPSGINDTQLISELVSVSQPQQKINSLQTQQTTDQTKISAYSQLTSLLTSLQSAATAVSTDSAFDVFNATSTDSSVATLTGGDGAVDSTYDMKVSQLASSEKMISGDNLITSQTASLSSQGINVGDISIDGTTITIGATDTIQDLRSKINSATDSDGNPLNVTASVVQTSSTDFRLILTSNNTGSAGDQYQDVSGSTLENLGIITDASGDKGNTTQQLTSSTDVASAFSALAVGQTISFTGLDHNGNSVSSSFTKTASSTLNNLLTNISSMYNGLATVTTNGSGNLVITDNDTGTSQLSMSALSLGGTPVSMNVTTVGSNGEGVLDTGKDAYLTIENIPIVSSTNTVSNFMSGYTFNLQKADPSEVVTVGITRDDTTIQNNIQAVLDAYNNLLDYVNSATAYADPTVANSQNGPLAGDMTAQDILSQVRDVFDDQSNFSTDGYNSFTMIGLTTDDQTGHLSLDSSMFNTAMTTNFADVERLFTMYGSSSNANVTLGWSTSDTQSGNYTLTEPDPDHLTIQLQGDPNTYTSDARTGDVVSFSSGPATGLELTAPAGSIGTGNTVSFTYSNGFSANLTNLINGLTDPSTGIITSENTDLQDDISDCSDQITTLQTQVTAYQTQLQNQFAAMEEAISSMQSQSSQMISSLGGTTSSSTSSLSSMLSSASLSS